MNGTIQRKKDSRSDFQGLLFVFECIVVIIASYLLKRRFTYYRDRPSLLWNFQYREFKIMPVHTHYVATGLSARIYLPVHGVFTQLSPKMKYFRF